MMSRSEMGWSSRSELPDSSRLGTRVSGSVSRGDHGGGQDLIGVPFPGRRGVAGVRHRGGGVE